MKACLISKIPASSPPQKIAVKGLDGEFAGAVAIEEVDEVLMAGLPFFALFPARQNLLASALED